MKPPLGASASSKNYEEKQTQCSNNKLRPQTTINERGKKLPKDRKKMPMAAPYWGPAALRSGGRIEPARPRVASCSLWSQWASSCSIVFMMSGHDLNVTRVPHELGYSCDGMRKMHKHCGLRHNLKIGQITRAHAENSAIQNKNRIYGSVWYITFI